MGKLSIRMAPVRFALGVLALWATVATEVWAQVPAVDPAAEGFFFGCLAGGGWFWAFEARSRA